MGRSQHRNESTSHPNREVRKSSSSQKVPKITASLYLLFPWYRVPFSNPRLGIQDILVGIMPVTCLQKFQHCWWAFGGFQNLWAKTTLRLCFPCCLKILKRTCYKDLSKQNLGRKDLGEMLFLLHKKSFKKIHLWQPNNEKGVVTVIFMDSKKLQKAHHFGSGNLTAIISGNQCLEVRIVASWRLLKLKWPGMLVKALGPEEW